MKYLTSSCFIPPPSSINQMRVALLILFFFINLFHNNSILHRQKDKFEYKQKHLAIKFIKFWVQKNCNRNTS